MSELQTLRQAALFGGWERFALADWLEESGDTRAAAALRGKAPTIDLPLAGFHTMRFAWVPPGESWLGGGAQEEDGILQPVSGSRKFVLEKPLWCGIYPVTQAAWEAVMGKNPSRFRLDEDDPGVWRLSQRTLLPPFILCFKHQQRFPVENVSWEDVKLFLRRVNRKISQFGYLFRLPTADEWEYICRGGPITKKASRYDFYFAKSDTDLTPVRSIGLTWCQANFSDGSYARSEPEMQTSPVGAYKPNPLGIYDMHGNVWEWTSTVHANQNAYRECRGGGFASGESYCAARTPEWVGVRSRSPDLGFRVVVEPI